MKKFPLVAEVLDEQLKDVNDVNAGRVDGIVLELRDGKPPKLAYIEVSPITLLERFSRRLARWYAVRIDRHIEPARGVPFRIPWTRVTRDGPTLRIDLDIRATPIMAIETWLKQHIVSRIPGG
jgi:hypothetical protein